MSDRAGALAGRVVIVGSADPDAREAALAAAGAGAVVVLVAGDDADGLAGAVARQVVDEGGRAAVFSGSLADPDDRAALAEMLAELY